MDGGGPGSQWALTREALARFLAGLDADAERAGEKYEAIRLRLVKFFDWRGAHHPEDCADVTINRVIRKLDAGETLADLETYCLGVARLVFLETLKRPERRHVPFEEAPALAAPAAAGDADEEDEKRRCFERCLRELPPESRALVLEYYRDERRTKIDNRQALADRLAIPLNALRSRVQRIRDRLERCIEKCRSR
ncbi:MAG: hypothetical protein SF339_01025 [Blastocatellia bacterium]|nr:hypothetical protein [Blastocatellia bacterium]